MKTLVAMMALVVGLTFVGVTFVQADEKAAPAAAGKKEEKKADKKPETKSEKK